jgi:hypothetical protein
VRQRVMQRVEGAILLLMQFNNLFKVRLILTWLYRMIRLDKLQ